MPRRTTRFLGLMAAAIATAGLLAATPTVEAGKGRGAKQNSTAKAAKQARNGTRTAPRSRGSSTPNRTRQGSHFAGGSARGAKAKGNRGAGAGSKRAGNNRNSRSASNRNARANTGHSAHSNRNRHGNNHGRHGNKHKNSGAHKSSSGVYIGVQVGGGGYGYSSYGYGYKGGYRGNYYKAGTCYPRSYLPAGYGYSYAGNRFGYACNPGYGFGASYGYASPWYSTRTVQTYASDGWHDYQRVTVNKTTVIDDDRVDFDDAWDQIAYGRWDAAQIQFGRLAQRNESDGVVRIGYAMAAAKQQRYETAAWALRRALTVDPRSPLGVPDSQTIRDRARALAALISQTHPRGLSEADRWFLVGAMELVAGNRYAAMDAVDKSIEYADEDISTRNLRDLISELGH